MEEKKHISFNDSNVQTIVRDWWSGLERSPADRAVLRRCRSATDVVFIPAFHRLRWVLSPHGFYNSDRLAAVAGVLAHVKGDEKNTSVAARMAKPTKTSRSPRVSGLRFRRLLRKEYHDELYAFLIRLLGLLEYRANVIDLAQITYYWGPNVRKGMAYEYYDHSPDRKDITKA